MTTSSSVSRTIAGKTATLALTVDEFPVLAVLSCPAVRLPAGTWRVTAVVNAKTDAAGPDPRCPPAVVKTTTVTTGGTGNVTLPTVMYRFHRQLDSTVTVRWSYRIDRSPDAGATWRPYAGLAGGPLSTVVAQAPPRLAIPCTFGVNIQLYQPDPGTRDGGTAWLGKMLLKAAAAGAKVVRSSAPWPLTQVSSGSGIDPGVQAWLDTFANNCRALGLKWLTMTSPQVALPWATYPYGWSMYENYVQTLLARYGDIIVGISPFNEPNLASGLDLLNKTYIYGGGGKWTYDRMVLASWHLSNAVLADKAANPTHNVARLSPALGPPDPAYLQALYTAGMGQYIDAVDIHPYNNRADLATFTPPGFSAPPGTIVGDDHICSDPAVGWVDGSNANPDSAYGDSKCLACAVLAVTRVMDANGDSAKKVWISEWGTSSSSSGTLAGVPVMSANEVSENLKAAYLQTAMRQAARLPRLAHFSQYMLYLNDYTGSTPPGELDRHFWNSLLGMTTPDGGVDLPALAAYTQVATGAVA